ncbi:hypothetical protein GA0061078_0246 [Bifidobacterium bohemicum]|uniref:Uncharacterized protein n=1 Tax=Bifidobacterium bohemicum DSM 22767 TaxID=1437606 RepID=A0A086ZFV7_9BIFI|nr:hypothetical protein [Bifidobacterium bohemicum]KFI45407.1 hypothetical protein BBOH_1184 [Bifidobacterium bohemicum DSM 22767]SCB73609.1 hypothetical protein GA0061078_0246 [Bifidobacterium bohemicum]
MQSHPTVSEAIEQTPAPNNPNRRWKRISSGFVTLSDDLSDVVDAVKPTKPWKRRLICLVSIPLFIILFLIINIAISAADDQPILELLTNETIWGRSIFGGLNLFIVLWLIGMTRKRIRKLEKIDFNHMD